MHNPFTYFGQTYDENTGLYYLRARYYDPTTGRFTQQDPSEDGYNWYVYGNNNPIMYVDENGESATSTVSLWIPNIRDIDGPYPYADFVAFVILVGAVSIDGISYGVDRVNDAWKAYQQSLKREKIRISNQYKFAKETGQKAERNSTTKNNKKGTKSLPTKGKPNSSKDLLNPDGTVKQRRYYGPDGKAEKDIDYNHSNGDGSHTFPHTHKWDWSTGKAIRK